jgi:hypothetical protein
MPIAIAFASKPHLVVDVCLLYHLDLRSERYSHNWLLGIGPMMDISVQRRWVSDLNLSAFTVEVNLPSELEVRL